MLHKPPEFDPINHQKSWSELRSRTTHTISLQPFQWLYCGCSDDLIWNQFKLSSSTQLLSDILLSNGMLESNVERTWGIDIPPDTTISVIKEQIRHLEFDCKIGINGKNDLDLSLSSILRHREINKYTLIILQRPQLQENTLAHKKVVSCHKQQNGFCTLMKAKFWEQS